jgi:glycogen operon protein
MQIWPGNPYPQGSTWDGAGVNCTLFSESDITVDLYLFDGLGGDADAV